MTSPGGPGFPGDAGHRGGAGGSWSGDDPGFGVPRQPQPSPYHQAAPDPLDPQQYQVPQQYQPELHQPQEYQQPQHYQPQDYQQPQQPRPGHAAGGAHGRPPAQPSGPHWGRIALVAGAAVVVVVGVVFAALWLFGGSGGAVASTETFFEAVKAKDTDAAVAVTCNKAPTLAEQFGRAMSGVEATLGSLTKIEVTEAETPTTAPGTRAANDSAQPRESTEFVLRFENGNVRGRATLVDEDSKWKVCFVDLEPPQRD